MLMARKPRQYAESYQHNNNNDQWDFSSISQQQYD